MKAKIEKDAIGFGIYWIDENEGRHDPQTLSPEPRCPSGYRLMCCSGNARQTIFKLRSDAADAIDETKRFCQLWEHDNENWKQMKIRIVECAVYAEPKV